MTKLEYTFKTDILFKMLFVKNPGLLKHLVSQLLGISLESIGQFVITNSEIPANAIGEKFCRLDINMTVDGQRVDLEIQVRDEGSFPERVLFNWAREYSAALPSGKNYINLPRTIVISIIDFNLFDCSEYHSEFLPLEVTRHTLLSDKMSLHFFELKKLPTEVNADNLLLLWLSLFKAETEDEITKIEALEVPIMKEAINAYHHITNTPEFRELERLRSKALYDEAQALYHARQEEREKWQTVIAEKDAKLADKDTKLADKDVVNEQLRSKIAELQAQLEKRTT